MISSILSRLVILLFGTLYPAYASYKAVRTKNVKEYVKWMMYWIVFALFTCIETFTDVFLSWFPFYYEIKIVLVVWLLSPATKGSSILYRKFVHPTLSSREQEIDEYITKAKEQSYRQVLDLGSKGVSALMQTAIKGGGGIVNQLKKSYSLSDLTDTIHDDDRDEADDVVITDPRLIRRRRSPHRSSSSTSAIYFSEVDVRSDRIASIQSAEDISSGYSSGETLYPGQPPKLLAREGLQRTGSLTRSRTTRVTRSAILKKSDRSDDSDENEVFDTNIIFLNDKAKRIDGLPVNADSSSSEAEFLDSLDTMHDHKTLGEDFDSFNAINDRTLLTACRETKVDLDVMKILTKNTSISSLVSVSDDNDKKEHNLNIVSITKDVDTFSNFLQNLIESKNEKVVPSTKQDADSKETQEAVVKVDCRGGRYNKKAAPPPPPPAPQHSKQDQSIDSSTSPSPIKATLVLKPGVVKSIGSKEEGKEIFVQSPKSKRRGLVNRSPSSVSTSSTGSRGKHALSKLMKLPKKIGFWNKDESSAPKESQKRLSWHCYVDGLKPLSDSKLQSKSDNNLVQSKDEVVAPLHANLPRSCSQLSVKSLTESPLARRRLKIIRRYVDEDID